MHPGSHNPTAARRSVHSARIPGADHGADALETLADGDLRVSDEEQFGDRLQRLREARGMTRVELAEACNRLGRRTDRRDIIRYEEGGYHDDHASEADE